MEAYCSRVGRHASQVRFMVHDERITPEDTAEKLGLEDEDLIDVSWEFSSDGDSPASGVGCTFIAPASSAARRQLADKWRQQHRRRLFGKRRRQHALALAVAPASGDSGSSLASSGSSIFGSKYEGGIFGSSLTSGRGFFGAPACVAAAPAGVPLEFSIECNGANRLDTHASVPPEEG